MEQLILKSQHGYPLRELVEGALANEARLLQAGIARTETRLREFEAERQLSTAEFLRRYQDDVIAETLELAEWIGEARLLERMQQKLAVLQDIQIAS
jgi:arginase family enzyme